jgi:hypothetical protein
MSSLSYRPEVFEALGIIDAIGLSIGAVSVLFVEPSVSYSPIVVSGVDAVSPTFGLPANCASYRVDEAGPTIARVWYAAAGSIAKKIRTFALFRRRQHAQSSASFQFIW